MSPGQQRRPADLGKAGCSRPAPGRHGWSPHAERPHAWTAEPYPRHHSSRPGPPGIPPPPVASTAPTAPLRARWPACSQNPAATKGQGADSATPDPATPGHGHPDRQGTSTGLTGRPGIW